MIDRVRITNEQNQGLVVVNDKKEEKNRSILGLDLELRFDLGQQVIILSKVEKIYSRQFQLRVDLSNVYDLLTRIYAVASLCLLVFNVW